MCVCVCVCVLSTLAKELSFCGFTAKSLLQHISTYLATVVFFTFSNAE